MKTTDFVRGKEWQILSDYGFTRTDNNHIDCPVCGREKCFRLNEHKGEPRWICSCGNGNMWSLLVETMQLRFHDVTQLIDERYGNKCDYHRAEMLQPKPRHQVKGLLQIAGSQGQIYLNNRGIKLMPESYVCWNESVYHKQSGQNHGCIHSEATDCFFDKAMIHHTYIDNGFKIRDTPKKMFKVKDGKNIAVKMFPSDSCLGVGEGVENSLSAGQIYNVPVWSSLSSALMKSFRAPHGVKVLIIFADHECHGAGLAAAFVCGNANILCKNDVIKVIIKWPEKGDFNNVLREPGSTRIYEWVLTR